MLSALCTGELLFVSQVFRLFLIQDSTGVSFCKRVQRESDALIRLIRALLV